MRTLYLWSPSLVLFAWATIAALGWESRVTTVLGRVLLGVSLGLHIREEVRNRRCP